MNTDGVVVVIGVTSDVAGRETLPICGGSHKKVNGGAGEEKIGVRVIAIGGLFFGFWSHGCC